MSAYADWIGLGWIGWQEYAIVGLLAVLLFGRRLPEVGRSLGRALVEFKKGLRGVQDEIEHAGHEDDDDAAGVGQGAAGTSASQGREDQAASGQKG